MEKMSYLLIQHDRLRTGILRSKLMKNLNMRILRWLIFFALMSPLVVNAADWQIDINGALRISYNLDDCQSSCLDLWRRKMGGIGT